MIFRHWTAVRSAREVADGGVGAINVTFAEREELLLEREGLRDQLGAGVRVAPRAMPASEEAGLQRERLLTAARRGRLRREFARALQVTRETRPTNCQSAAA